MGVWMSVWMEVGWGGFDNECADRWTWKKEEFMVEWEKGRQNIYVQQTFQNNNNNNFVGIEKIILYCWIFRARDDLWFRVLAYQWILNKKERKKNGESIKQGQITRDRIKWKSSFCLFLNPSTKFINKSINKSINKFINKSINKSIKSVNKSVSKINKSINKSINKVHQQSPYDRRVVSRHHVHLCLRPCVPHSDGGVPPPADEDAEGGVVGKGVHTAQVPVVVADGLGWGWG